MVVPFHSSKFRIAAALKSLFSGLAVVGCFALGTAAFGEGESTVLAGPEVEAIWIDGYRSQVAHQASHFILEGSGVLRTRVFAVAEAVDSVVSAAAMRSLSVELSRFDGIEWQEVASFDLSSVDYGFENSALPGARVGEVEIELPAGSYLAQFNLPENLSVLTTVQLEFLDSGEGSVPRVVNASVLGQVGGSRLKREIGYRLSGPGERPVLVRNVGPTLKNFGLDQVVENPALMVMRDGLKLAANDDWWSGISISADQMASAMQLMGAFQLNRESADSALEVESGEGTYQVVSRSGLEKDGFEIIEVYLD